MTIKANRFTPDVMLSAPRRSAGVPNRNMDKILYSVTTHDLAGSKTAEIRLFIKPENSDKSWKSIIITEDKNASEPTWVGDRVLIAVANKDITELYLGEPENFESSKRLVGTIEGSPFGFKVLEKDDGYSLLFAAKSNPDGSLYNDLKPPKRMTTGRLYTKPFATHWDTYVTSQRNTLWLAESTKGDAGIFKAKNVRNVLASFDKPLECPIPPFPDVSHYDIGKHGIVFVAKDPDSDVSTHTKQNLYFVSFEDSASIKKIDLPGFEGATSAPTFSPDGKSIACLGMREDGYEADKNQLLLIKDVTTSTEVLVFYDTSDGKGSFDRSPSSVSWSPDGKNIYLVAERFGVSAIYTVPVADVDLKAAKEPKMIWGKDLISSLNVLENGVLFVSASTLVDNSVYYTVDPSNQQVPNLISSNTGGGNKFGLSESQVSDIWFAGELQDIHAWVMRPSNFKETEKYPLAYLIHGGPQGAWENGWSTRWNPALFAEAGYVVIMPNPTGSTGYGQALQDGTKLSWGGTPYNDLVRGFEYIEQNLKYVDTERAVALGASYGGFMVNWIQGHDLGRKFKALVCHDGVFSMTAQLASDEQYFPIREFGGDYMEHSRTWLQYDPSRFTANWATPQLVIHSAMDLRLLIGEGLAAFNVLQQKGIESKFLTFPDENHWVLKPENSLLWHAVVFEWINKFVGLPDVGKEKWAKEVLADASTER